MVYLRSGGVENYLVGCTVIDMDACDMVACTEAFVWFEEQTQFARTVRNGLRSRIG